MKTKLFSFSQNNSFGSFDVDEKLCQEVYVEAENASEANDIAKNLGIYFNGVENEIDCSCCGDRWNEVEDGDKIEADFESLLESIQKTVNRYFRKDHFSRVFLKNGQVIEINKQKD